MKYIILVLLISITSCKVHRNVDKFVRAVDSTGFFKKDSTSVRTVDSTKTATRVKTVETTENKDYVKVTVIEEYKDTPVIKRVTITETDKGVRRVTTHTIKRDSTGLKKTDSIVADTEQKTTVIGLVKEKLVKVKRTQGGFWINIGLFVLGALVILFIARRLYLKYNK